MRRTYYGVEYVLQSLLTSYHADLAPATAASMARQGLLALALSTLWGLSSPQRTTSVPALRRELLAAAELGDLAGLREAARTLEEGFVPIQTKVFFDVAVGGLWELRFSDWPLRADPGM